VCPSSPYAHVIVTPEAFVGELAAARIGETFNQYSCSPLRRQRFTAYLASRSSASVLLVGEAPGYRGARISGIPFTSERQLTGTGPAEATATVVHRVLRELGLEARVLLWNVVPTHPGTETSNRAPRADEVEAAATFLAELSHGRQAIAVGRLAERRLAAPYVRHPARGGAHAFRAALIELLA
jgi:uracil-DNA glycosylase family 4